jgi:hypothetical protein
LGYDINDTNTGNLWASFLTEQEAPAEVRRAVTASGEDAIASWSLGRSDHVGTALFDKALIAQAMRPVTARPH